MAHPPQSSAVESLLAQLETDAEQMRELMLRLVVPQGSPMFPLDFLAFAAVKRHASTSSAFICMVRSWNMGVARALLRTHLDTSLRFSAAWHVSEPHSFATAVLGGARIDKLKTKTGARLTDSHLVDLQKEGYPWLPIVYERLSGYVHFSGSHIFDSIEQLDEDGRSLQFLVSDQDLNFPEFSWLEILECFRSATSILEHYLEGWGATKQLPESELRALRGDA